MITHDRYFLDRVANVMLELDHGRLFRYEANYSRFLELKAEREEREAASEQKRQNFFAERACLDPQRAKARTTKQKARIERFEKLKDQEMVHSSGELDVSVASTRLGRKILEIEGLRMKIDDKTLIQDLSYIAVPEDRIGIVGPNGGGKSTLLNLIAGRIQPGGGEVVLGPTVKLGYFTQEHQEMDGSQRVIEYIKDEAEVVRTADGSAITAPDAGTLSVPARAQWTPIAKLSGGEAPLVSPRVLMSAPNVPLDEPTNDLDIQTLSVLEQYLDEFPGVCIVVSHDRFFLDRTVDKIMAFEGDGQIRVHVGSYSEYAEWMRRHGGEVAGSKAEASIAKSASGAAMARTAIQLKKRRVSA